MKQENLTVKKVSELELIACRWYPKSFYDT